MGIVQTLFFISLPLANDYVEHCMRYQIWSQPNLLVGIEKWASYGTLAASVPSTCVRVNWIEHRAAFAIRQSRHSSALSDQHRRPNDLEVETICRR